MKTPDQIIKEHTSCTCDEIYTSRKLTDPDCIYCEWGSEIELMMDEYAKQAFKAARKFETLLDLSDTTGIMENTCKNIYKTFEDYKNSLK